MTQPPFDRVVTEHGPTVLRVCRALLDPVDADDAWSETFLAALRAYPGLPAEANHQAWLVTIAHRKAIDLLRARRRRAVPAERIEDLGRPADAGGRGGPVDGLAPDDAVGEDLQEALRGLSLRQRQAVAYHHLGGLPYAEVAALLGGTPEAARRAAADGIAKLRRELRPQPRPDEGDTP